MATRRRNSVIFTPEDCLKWREPHLKPPTFHQWSRHRQEVWLLVYGIADLTPLGWEYLRVQGGLSRGPQPISSTLLLRLLHRGQSRVPHLGVCAVNACTLLEVLMAKAFHLVPLMVDEPLPFAAWRARPPATWLTVRSRPYRS